MRDIVMKRPENLEALVEALSSVNDTTYLLGGGTDFMIKLRKHRIYSGTIINLTQIKELNYILREKDRIKIGAITTFTEIASHPLIKQYANCLAEAADKVGSTQIRNVATIAGNIANAAPCADTVTALMVLDAKIKIIDGNGETREKSLDEVIIGSERNTLEKNEAIIEILIPVIEKKSKSAFAKLGSRTAVTISKLNIAVVLEYDQENSIHQAKVALGALGPKAFKSDIVEKALLGKKPVESLLLELQEALMEQVDASILGRGSHPYKRDAIQGLADDIFYKLFASTSIGGEV
ncbi:carbon-monoxide dehydrogenase medium subunit/xanthine dehydrogenase FAD-binding subunit [Anaerovirgula multivorans]|uniref:Carbon-monoxide dehydrogenase medium subunit/xanthine dehydrogenase FAD-binding subunit n=1 Tax=Anaerovirgula multivorans TaxID=312168 RepID=A0A239I8F8_9FIRM|nr:FAD binding domain-containing protein [Anaerovirgula multivorans]SNS89672.1 carbon-monoxide dehydrogenase medium subunit/xanthine dehydrogenase FAD-binding subunit [Anaerovirgula multivorans]